MEGTLCHSKIVTISNTQSSTITLSDSAGNLIKCNHYAVSVSEAGGAGYLLVVPSGLEIYPSIPVGNASSGTFGCLMDTKGTQYITLGAGKRTSALTITNYSGASKTILICYGIQYNMNGLDKGYSPGI